MEIQQLTEDYKKFTPYYQKLQGEVLTFLNELVRKKGVAVDVASIVSRPNQTIKELDSILRNVRRPDKYKEVKKLTDINDVAGVRITCHCQSDCEILFGILEGELKQQYTDVSSQKKDGVYNAHHFNFAKDFTIDGEAVKLFCEVQLRTVLGDAWAIQDTRYVYKNDFKEGESQILSGAISNILNSCESLWELVKEKSKEKGTLTSAHQIMEKISNIIKPTQKVAEQANAKNTEIWFSGHHQKALAGFDKIEPSSYVEIKVSLPQAAINIEKTELLNAARIAPIHTFGWPIGLFMDRPEYKPKPITDGIAAEIAVDRGNNSASYDYWAIKQDGTVYIFNSLFENMRKPEQIFFDTRTIRLTEALMYTLNLFNALRVSNDQFIKITIKHGGLKGKQMGAAGNRLLFEKRYCNVNEVETSITTTLQEIDQDMPNLVAKFTQPLFEMFDFFEINKSIIDEIVTKYRMGIIS